jgi:hypothetical protein
VGHKLKLRRRWISLAVVLLGGLPLFALGGTRWGGGEGIVIDAETRQPVVGVQVLFWLNTTTYGGVPWLKSATACSVDYLAISDAHGKFLIPEDALVEPTSFTLRQSMRDFHVMAYKKGYEYSITELTGIGSDPDRGALRRQGRLTVKIEVSQDMRSPVKRQDYLARSFIAGCGCNQLHRDMRAEIEELRTEAIRLDREEQLRSKGRYDVSFARGIQTSLVTDCR